MSHDPIFVAAVIVLLGFLIGLAKGGFNGLGGLLTPVLSLVLPVSLAVGVLLPMLLVGDAFAVFSYWREWDGRVVRRALPAAAAGALLGTFLLSQLSSNSLRLILAGFVLLLVAYRWLSGRLERLRYQPAGWHAPAAGFVAGVASGLFNNGGPPFNSYLLLQNLPPRRFIGTSAVFFAILNVLKVPGFLYTGVLNLQLLLAYGWVVIFIPPGILAARWLVQRVEPRAFEGIVVALLLVSSLMLVAQGV